MKPIKYCTVEGCEVRAFGGGYCQKHYMRVRRRGTLETVKAPNGAHLDWAHNVALQWEDDECCLFPFPTGSHGYGELMVSGEKSLMHRYVCERSHGSAPTQQHQAAHRCGERRCGNPKHIRWATVSENAADKILHGREARGEAHGQAKLSEDDVIAIRQATGNQSEIAEQFGVVQQTVSDIKLGRRWAWL